MRRHVCCLASYLTHVCCCHCSCAVHRSLWRWRCRKTLVHQRSQTALTGYPAADCAGPVQLRAQTASCRRALMACAIIARLACRGWPAPLTNSGTAVYPRTTQRPQSTGPHGLQWGSPRVQQRRRAVQPHGEDCGYRAVDDGLPSKK